MSPLSGLPAPDAHAEADARAEAEAEARGRAWTGGFVQEAVGISVQTDASRSLVPLEALVGLALRDNPKRAQLLVSTVLAKHVPTVPAVAVVAGELLGLLVAASLDCAPVDTSPHKRFARQLHAQPSANPQAQRHRRQQAQRQYQQG